MCNLGMAVEMKGVRLGIEQGVKQGAERTLIQNIKMMVKNLNMTSKQAMDALEIPESDQARYAAMLESNN